MKLGITELIVIFVVALIVLGPDKLPEYAKKFGAALREFRKASAEITKDIKEGVVEPLEEMQRPLTDAIAPINEMTQEIENNLNEVKNSVNSVGKPKPAQKTASEPEKPLEATPSVQQEEPEAFETAEKTEE